MPHTHATLMLPQFVALELELESSPLEPNRKQTNQFSLLACKRDSRVKKAKGFQLKLLEFPPDLLCYLSPSSF